MNSFIADYLQDPSLAVAAAQASCRQTMWLDNIDEEEIYRQIAVVEYVDCRALGKGEAFKYVIPHHHQRRCAAQTIE